MDKPRSDTQLLNDRMLSQRKKEDEKKNVLGFLEKRPDSSQELQKDIPALDKVKNDNIMKSSQPSVFERFSRTHIEENLKETEHATQYISKKPDYSKEIVKVEEKEEKLDKTTSLIQPSIFQRLALPIKEEDELKHSTQDMIKKPDISQELEKDERQEEKRGETEETDKPSLFQRLFRRIKSIFVRVRELFSISQ